MIPGTTLRINIQQQNAKIGINTQRAGLEIEQPRADVQITQKPAEMTIDQGPGTLQIDSTEFRAALGYKSVMRMTSDIAMQAREIVLEAIGDIAEAGNQLARIEKGVSIADIALQNQERGPMPIEDAAPPSSIEMNYTEHPTAVEFRLGGADINITPRYPVVTFKPGSIDIYVAQKNWLQIDVKGQHLNMTF